ncbi:hypothetical protein RND81_11G077400 [Saponaria officinalis]|uniref:Uncharacterized protein n=1 Tax=Saponaria officinalis TaxID=3572 RepID=A0AAW1HJ17_SAPOF
MKLVLHTIPRYPTSGEQCRLTARTTRVDELGLTILGASKMSVCYMHSVGGWPITYLNYIRSAIWENHFWGPYHISISLIFYFCFVSLLFYFSHFLFCFFSLSFYFQFQLVYRSNLRRQKYYSLFYNKK